MQQQKLRHRLLSFHHPDLKEMEFDLDVVLPESRLEPVRKQHQEQPTKPKEKLKSFAYYYLYSLDEQ
jgi:hypothetical protein